MEEEKKKKSMLSMSNIPIMWLVVSAIFGAGVTFASIQFQGQINSANDARLEQEALQHYIELKELIQKNESISNDEDDGVRADFERADLSIREVMALEIQKLQIQIDHLKEN